MKTQNISLQTGIRAAGLNAGNTSEARQAGGEASDGGTAAKAKAFKLGNTQ